MSLATFLETCPAWLLKFRTAPINKSSEQNFEVLRIMSDSCTGVCKDPISASKAELIKKQALLLESQGGPLTATSAGYSGALTATTAGYSGALTATPGSYGVTGKKRMEDGAGGSGSPESKFLQLLYAIREPIVNYQEQRGLSREEHGSFVNLVTSLCQHAYCAALTILTMLYNLLPLLEGFVYFARFIIDKLIEIVETEDTAERSLKFLLFLAEVIIIFILLMIIFGLILLPVWQLFSQLIYKFWGMLSQ